MAYILNIGLARKGNSNIGLGTVLRELVQSGFIVGAYKVCVSDTEATVVAEVALQVAPSRSATFQEACKPLHHLAVLLGQDCIAIANYYEKYGEGALIGPRADKWGEFNPEYFLLLDGSRLAQPALKLAA